MDMNMHAHEHEHTRACLCMTMNIHVHEHVHERVWAWTWFGRPGVSKTHGIACTWTCTWACLCDVVSVLCVCLSVWFCLYMNMKTCQDCLSCRLFCWQTRFENMFFNLLNKSFRCLKTAQNISVVLRHLKLSLSRHESREWNMRRVDASRAFCYSKFSYVSLRIHSEVFETSDCFETEG